MDGTMQVGQLKIRYPLYTLNIQDESYSAFPPGKNTFCHNLKLLSESPLVGPFIASE